MDPSVMDDTMKKGGRAWDLVVQGDAGKAKFLLLNLLQPFNDCPVA